MRTDRVQALLSRSFHLDLIETPLGLIVLISNYLANIYSEVVLVVFEWDVCVSKCNSLVVN